MTAQVVEHSAHLTITGGGDVPSPVCILSSVLVIVFVFVYYLKSPVSIHHCFAVHCIIIIIMKFLVRLLHQEHRCITVS